MRPEAEANLEKALKLLDEGYKFREVAEKLNISLRTVCKYMETIGRVKFKTKCSYCGEELSRRRESKQFRTVCCGRIACKKKQKCFLKKNFLPI